MQWACAVYCHLLPVCLCNIFPHYFIWYDIWYGMTWCNWCDMIWYGIWYDMIWYDVMWCNWCDVIWYVMVCYDMLYLTSSGVTPCGSSTLHIYIQTIHRTTKLTQAIHRTTQSTQTIHRTTQSTQTVHRTTQSTQTIHRTTQSTQTVHTRSVWKVSVLIFLWTNLKCSILLRHTSA
jgi:hypothetical protein